MKRRATRADYRVIAETDRFGAALSACDLVLARAGSSVWEIAAAGKPAILVPYPFATGDHQALNAQHFVRAGGAIMVRELDLDDVPELVRSLLGDARTAAADGRGDASRGPPRCGGRDRRRAGRARARHDGPPSLVRRHRRRRAVRVRAARARVGRRGRRLGPRAHAVPRAARRRAARDLRGAGRPRRVGGGRLVGVPVRAGPAARGVPARARRGAAVGRGRAARTGRGRPRR